MDVRNLSDAELVHLVQQTGCPPALPELERRHLAGLWRRIERLARRYRLGREDTEGALQDAFLSLREAVAAFHPPGPAVPAPGAFRAFLWLRARSRFLDFIKRLRRRRQRVVCWVDFFAGADGPEGHDPDDPPGARVLVDCDADPVLDAERHEELERLGQALDQLPDETRLICEGVMAGLRLREIARRYALEERQVYYQWGKVRPWLAGFLWNDSAAG